jgi:hypothetical protein
MSKNENLDITVDFFGLRTFQKAVRDMDPELAKELRKTTRAPVASVYNSARRLVSQIGDTDIPSGWRSGSGSGVWSDPTQKGWNNAKVRNGIKLQPGKRGKYGVTNLYRISNNTAAGNIYEFADSPRTPQGASFVRKISKQRPSRLIWRAWDEAGGDKAIMPAVNEAIEDIYKEFEKRMSAVPAGDRVGLR